MANALTQYTRYQNKSSYIDELTDKEIYELQISELTGDINRASNYEAEIFYCGTLPFDNAYDILSKNLPLVANERPSQSPQDKPLAQDDGEYHLLLAELRCGTSPNFLLHAYAEI